MYKYAYIQRYIYYALVFNIFTLQYNITILKMLSASSLCFINFIMLELHTFKWEKDFSISTDWFMCVNISVYTHTHICLPIWMCVYIHLYIYLSMYICIFICLYGYMYLLFYISVSVYIYILSMLICLYKSIYHLSMPVCVTISVSTCLCKSIHHLHIVSHHI